MANTDIIVPLDIIIGELESFFRLRTGCPADADGQHQEVDDLFHNYLMGMVINVAVSFSGSCVVAVWVIGCMMGNWIENLLWGMERSCTATSGMGASSSLTLITFNFFFTRGAGAFVASIVLSVVMTGCCVVRDIVMGTIEGGGGICVFLFFVAGLMKMGVAGFLMVDNE